MGDFSDAERFARDGCLVEGAPIVPEERLIKVRSIVDGVLRDEQKFSGSPKGYHWDTYERSGSLIKIDNPHQGDRDVLDLCCDAALVRFATRVMPAQMLQLWCSQFLIKLPSGSANGTIGWHRDWDYWTHAWTDDSELFTVWLALSAVGEDCGPVSYVRGSHRWDIAGPGNFFAADLSATRELMTCAGERWEEIRAILPAGGVAAHNWKTVHSSGPNSSSRPRVGLAMHFRTNRSTLKPGIEPGALALDDASVSPVLHGS